MTDTFEPQPSRWFRNLLVCCAGLVLLGWGVRTYVWPVSPGKEVATDDELTEEEDFPAEEPGPATDAAKAGNTGDKQAADAAKPPLGQIKILVPTKKFRKEGPRKALRLTFEDIDVEKVLNTKDLSVDLPQAMPEWMRKLDGQRVRLRGYMHPGSAFQTDGIKRFTFCRDTGACCFGPDPTIFYLIETTMKSGTSTEYVEREAFDVEGTFRIEPIVREKSGKVVEFYHLDDAQIVKR